MNECPGSIRSTTPDGETGSPPVVLNPAFVEELMGYPRGWTDCDASVTESYPQWRRAHGACSKDD